MSINLDQVQQNVDLLGIESDKNGDSTHREINFGRIHRQNSITDPVVQQSAMDPDRVNQLYHYNLDDFKNSIWENFLGSQVQISKLIERDQSFRITNRIVTKMGPIQLSIDNENLYSAWEHSFNSVIKDYQGVGEGQRMQTESWMCRPPNVLMFNLSRVDYDRTKQRLVKNNKRFEFDQTIYLDMFLNQNKEKAN
jgi:hypothetical protein